ncbi:MAG TPA: dihydrodipicolinate synthase family protein [Cyclobacteriaceae bacterium]|nr:dihydrodipicolinate synthase family protein [Cyclobacteriaceae bacterium]
MEIKHLKGLIAAPFTPMSTTGALNLDLVADYYRMLKMNGISGTFICGSTGEEPSLTLTEKKLLAAAWAEATKPSYIYESGVAPLTEFRIAGLVWYQGESNAHNIALHEELFKTMVNSWRKQWGYEFPVFYTQLSGMERPSWPRVRDSQRQMLGQLEKVRMAVTHDLGNRHDVHPKDKKPVGERLAAWALGKTYQKELPYSGPLFDTVRFYNSESICIFLFDKGLTTSDGYELRGFELAGSDMIFTEAKAIIDGDKVRVSAGAVEEPKYVRYAWQPFTTANLVNESGFPASTFTSFSFNE